MNSIVSNLHYQLTSKIEDLQFKSLVLDFAKELGWNPSYFINSSKDEKTNGYLVIEHGLQNSAILSFLNTRNDDLTNSEEENLLSLSYNNLVNWHITIDERFINYYYILNREKRKVETRKIEPGNESEALSVKTFYEIIERKPNSNIKALDDVLIDNISRWKRIISAELNNEVSLVSLSHLFNTVIFLRSIEDAKKRVNELPSTKRTLVEIASQNWNDNLVTLVEKAESQLIEIPNFIVDKGKLVIFNQLQNHDVKRFFNSFYENEYNQFKYDFSIMTKQALSRIYQKYVSLLKVSAPADESQIRLFDFNEIPDESFNRESGAYYTPEYIARFFAKYINRKYTGKEFNNLKILEPAVGSGIFLRTLLETQIEERINNGEDVQIDKLFSNVYGVDNDPNACLATQLSLTLLHYVFNKQLSQPNVSENDSIEVMQQMITENNLVDIIISNPPYINQNKKDKDFTEPHKEILAGLTNGKIDIYQVFLKLSVDLLSPNGYGLFVLPHNFLIAESSKKLRNYILDNCTIEVVADLSAINVFENVSTYTMLLIIRKNGSLTNKKSSWLLKCKSSVGEALTQLLEENETETKFYQTYKAFDYFKPDTEWFVLNKSEFELLAKIKENKQIDFFLKLNQGVVTGKDNVFIRDSNEVSKSERKIYKQFLPDKQITSYMSEPDKSRLVFYPFVNNQLVSESDLENLYGKTWEYLNSKKEILSEERGKVRKGQLTWWKLHSSGKPQSVNSPKIVAPYLSITPKFSLDSEGIYITSRSPYFTMKESGDSDLLFYFLGILNSIPCYWALTLQAHKQSSGYNIFPIAILKKTPVPDPTVADNFSLVSKMILLVKRRIAEKNFLKQFELEKEINDVSCDLYKLSNVEKEILGINL